MAERIRAHRLSRQGRWETFEIPVDVAKWFSVEGRRYRTVVLDCLTLWLSNLQRQGIPAADVPTQVRDMLQAARRANGRVVIVTNELGLGIVPPDRATRRFRTLAGQVNQQVAEEADEVHLAMSGLTLRLK